MFGIKLTNKDFVEIIEGDEPIYAYWGCVKDVSITGINWTSGTQSVALFNMPKSVGALVFAVCTSTIVAPSGKPYAEWGPSFNWYGDGSQKTKISNYWGQERGWSKGDFYVFVPCNKIPKDPSIKWGIEMFDSNGVNTFNVRRPLLSYKELLYYDVPSMPLLDADDPLLLEKDYRAACLVPDGYPYVWRHKLLKPSTTYPRETHPVFIGALVHPTTGKTFAGLRWESDNWATNDNYSGFQPTGYTPIIDAGYYDQFPSLGDWPG